MNSVMPYLGSMRTPVAPSEHHLVGGSFVHLPAAELREPEQLVLEIMREVFFEHRTPPGRSVRELNPDQTEPTTLPVNERAALYALRGRKKGKIIYEATHFFAPAYSCLAEHGWLRSRQAAVLNNFLLAGPIRQHLWGPALDSKNGSTEQSQIVTDVVDALHGSNIRDSEDRKADFLAAILDEKIDSHDKEEARRRLTDKTTTGRERVMEIEDDELARRVTEDFRAICQLEKTIPRMEWIRLLMTFLRFAPFMWLLAQMRVARIVLGSILDAVDVGRIADTSLISDEIKKRNRGLLVPTSVPTIALDDHVEKYMKARIELDILMYCIDCASGNCFHSKQLTLKRKGSGSVSLDEFLQHVKNNKKSLENLERYREIAIGLPFRTFLAREGENFEAWRRPRNVGVGKQIGEAFRVLRRAARDEDEDGGYLFTTRKGRIKGTTVFPGPLLLKTVVYLAAKSNRNVPGGGGRLVLHDVESHFESYGVNFSASADARTKLIQRLQELGLLIGSPDAGTSVAVDSPYPLK